MSSSKQLLDKFHNLSPQTKKIIVYSILGILIILFGLYLYNEKQSTPNPHNKSNEIKLKDVVPEVSLLQKSLYQETAQKTRKLERTLKEIRAELQQTKQELINRKKEKNKQFEEKIKMLQEKMKQLSSQNTSTSPKNTNNNLTSKNYYTSSVDKYLNKNKPKSKNNSAWIGGILLKENKEIDINKKENQRKQEPISKKEKESSLYLPPSFISGDLLNGFAAFTSEQGKKEPVRTIIRLNDLAILPNEIKSDLKGCFVIGEAYGNLADERAHVRLLRLSCVARDGSSVIDSKVQGWVVDEDGRSGLRGRVIAKFGSFLARYFVAGFFQGFGDAYAESNYSLDYGNGNVIKLPNPSDAAKIGIGKGIGKAGKGLADFYLNLAKQTLPVIEIGAGKKVTVVFTTGTKLKIKKTCLKGRDGCIKQKTDGYGILNHIG